jgi:uncharacterized protein YukE
MPAGGPGDEPLVDILRWRRPVYTQEVDSLIAELAELWNGPSLESYLTEHDILWTNGRDSRLPEVEALLVSKREELYESAKTRGWDMQSLDARLAAQRRAVEEAWTGRGKA